MVLSIEVAKFKLLFKEFESYSNDQVQAFLDVAHHRIDTTAITEKQRADLVLYLAAHIATVSLKRYGASGGVSGLNEGKLELSYNSVDAQDNYDTTTYGLEFKRLQRQYLMYTQSFVFV